MPVPALDHEKPIDLIARDERQRRKQMIAGLESAGFA